MEKKSRENKVKSKNVKILAISLFCTVFWTFLCGIGIVNKFELRGYDLLLSLKKNPETRPEVMILEIDNISLEEIESWPWSRNIYADALVRLKELGVKSVTFDIEFLSPSNTMVDENALNDAITAFDGKLPDFSKILVDNDEKLARALQFFGNVWLTLNVSDLDIKYSDSEISYSKKRFLYDAEDPEKLILAGSRKSLVESLRKNIFDNLRNKKEDWSDPDVLKKYLVGFSPAMHLFASHAKGLGFPNVIIDGDGTRRRIELLNDKSDENGEKFAAQLAFAPLLKIIEPEKIVREKKNLVLYGAKIPKSDGTVIKKDIEIPLDENGRLLVNWKHDYFTSAFKHDNFLTLFQLDSVERNIVSVLGSLSTFLDSLDKVRLPDVDFISLNSAEVAKNLLYDYEDINRFKEFLLSECEGYDENGSSIGGGIADEDYGQYFELRKSFFENVARFCADGNLDEIADRLLAIKALLGDEQFNEISAQVEELFDVLQHEIDLYNKTFSDTYEKFNGTFCIVGNTASSTTDLGNTPFERSYPNVGTHANVYNTIMTEDFIKPLSWKWSVILAGLIALGTALLTANKRAFVQNTAGFIGIALITAVSIGAMTLFGLYIPLVTAELIVCSSYLFVSVYRFATSEKDKKFLETTFGAYVAPAVVEQIVKNPDIAKLGGKSDVITALFSDVKSFSGFTEVVNNEEGEEKGAERLVAILNGYLGVLSDAIMENHGTIDKYVGDEIVSFFGAPIHDDNNAFDACIAAIRMLEAEKKFNDENEAILPVNPATGKPFYLRSRVGLNTGNMVVGNMGTDKKLNYTIMGNNVNLASRLEGTNKVYGSWIMCSENTWKNANSGENEGKLIARKFDMVRVINVKKPVPIYNILGLSDEMDYARVEAANLFNEGMKWYLHGAEEPNLRKDISDLKKAYSYYEQAAKLFPADVSSNVFMERCANYIKNGLPDIWDGVYVMQSK